MLLALLAGATLSAGCSRDSSASADVVARVNGKDISTAQLEKQFLARTAGGQAPAAEEVDELKLQLLNQLINDEILLEMASQANLTATDAEVDVKFNDFKAQYNTEEQFQEALKQQKMSVDDLKGELRKSLTI